MADRDAKDLDELEKMRSDILTHKREALRLQLKNARNGEENYHLESDVLRLEWNSIKERKAGLEQMLVMRGQMHPMQLLQQQQQQQQRQQTPPRNEPERRPIPSKSRAKPVSTPRNGT